MAAAAPAASRPWADDDAEPRTGPAGLRGRRPPRAPLAAADAPERSAVPRLRRLDQALALRRAPVGGARCAPDARRSPRRRPPSADPGALRLARRDEDITGPRRRTAPGEPASSARLQPGPGVGGRAAAARRAAGRRGRPAGEAAKRSRSAVARPRTSDAEPRRPRRAVRAWWPWSWWRSACWASTRSPRPKTDEAAASTRNTPATTSVAPVTPPPRCPSWTRRADRRPSTSGAATPVRVPVTVLNATTSPAWPPRSPDVVAGGWQAAGVGAYEGGDVAASTVYFTEGDETQRQAAVQLVEQFPELQGPAPRFFELPAEVTAPGLVVVVTGTGSPDLRPASDARAEHGAARRPLAAACALSRARASPPAPRRPRDARRPPRRSCCRRRCSPAPVPRRRAADDVPTEDARVPSGTGADAVELDTTLYLPDGDDAGPGGGARARVRRQQGVGRRRRPRPGRARLRRPHLLGPRLRRSTGQIGLDDPRFEVADLSTLLDLLAERDDVVLDATGDPRVGVAGASYGGALALLGAAYDERIDAIAPQITWNSLTSALFPSQTGAATRRQRPPPRRTDAGVYKRLWSGLFFGVGSAPTRRPARRARAARRPGRRARTAGATSRSTPPPWSSSTCGRFRAESARPTRPRPPPGRRRPRSPRCSTAAARPASSTGSRPPPCWSRAPRTPCSGWARPTRTPAGSPRTARRCRCLVRRRPRRLGLRPGRRRPARPVGGWFDVHLRARAGPGPLRVPRAHRPGGRRAWGVEGGTQTVAAAGYPGLDGGEPASAATWR